ncbi:MAG: DUF4136 domain-containing protein [Gemmatimonadales bacterium]
MRRPSGLRLLLSLPLVAGCWYGFAGGGLPPDIKTVAIMPFDNLTTEPALTQQVNEAVKTAMEGRLGLRAAGENTADAIVRGSITRYEPDLPVAYTGTGATNSAGNQNVVVTQRALQMTVSIEIYDQKAAKSIWKRNGLIVEGNYAPGNEQEGRTRALDKLVTDIVDGAQSQW